MQFISTPPADEIVPTSSIGDIKVATVFPKIRVTIECGETTIYSADLYAHGSEVTIGNTADIIEAYFEKEGLLTHDVRVGIYNPLSSPTPTDFTMTCLYCRYKLPGGFLPEDVFFSTLDTQRVPQTAIMTLSGIMDEGTECRFHVSGIDSNGMPTSHIIDAETLENKIVVSIPGIASECELYADMQRVTAVSAVCGQRFKTFFVVDDTDMLEFRYRNCFNVVESVFIPGKTEMNTELAHEMARCGGKLQRYDVRTTRTYTQTISGLTRPEATSLTELAESRETAAVVDGVEYPVLITDAELKVDNDDSTLSTVKLTWQFDTERIRLFGDTLTALTPHFGIFTREFNDPYQ